MGIVKLLLVGHAKLRRAAYGLVGTGVPHDKRMSAARDLKADSVATPEGVRRRHHADPGSERPVGRLRRIAEPETHEPIAQIRGSSIGGDITEASEEVGVRK
jgi:hypothetical protein